MTKTQVLKYQKISLIRNVFENYKDEESLRELKKMGYTQENINKLVKKYARTGISISETF